MKPIICIPSYKRPSGIAIKRLKDIPLKKFLFVRSEELDIYREIAHENNFTLVKLKNVNDLGDTRQKFVNGVTSRDLTGYLCLMMT